MVRPQGALPPLGALCLLAQLGTARGYYTKQHNYMGADFFSRWWFWHFPDPTHGDVEYVNETVAWTQGLVNATEDRVYIGVDTESARKEKGRRSVKIYSNDIYESGLFVITLDHMPTGCGTWPAFWLVGGNSEEKWPAWGEIDLIETVHGDTRTSTTLHTDAGCDQSSLVAGQDFAGDWKVGADNLKPASNCDVHAEGQWLNQGCEQKGPEGSAGVPFNARGGGTFALQWYPEEGIKAWFWPAGSEPPDLLEDSMWGVSEPEPWRWGRPYSRFDLGDGACPRDHFRNLRLVFDLSFCGDLASKTFAAACPEQASQMSCSTLVSEHPEAFEEAYWSLRRLEVYQWTEPHSMINVMRKHAMFGSRMRILGAVPRAAGAALLAAAALATLLFAGNSAWRRMGSLRLLVGARVGGPSTYARLLRVPPARGAEAAAAGASQAQDAEAPAVPA